MKDSNTYHFAFFVSDNNIVVGKLTIVSVAS